MPDPEWTEPMPGEPVCDKCGRPERLHFVFYPGGAVTCPRQKVD